MKTPLLDQLKLLMNPWDEVFPQDRTRIRAQALALGMLCGVGQRTLTRALCFLGQDQEDWSADYKVFSRSPWKAENLFDPVWTEAVGLNANDHLVIGVDDTGLRRCGKKVPKTAYMRDPMSPPFHPNLMWGHRFIQAVFLAPLYKKDPTCAARALPVAFKEATPVRKPKKTASEEVKAEYKRLRKEYNLSNQFCLLMAQMREKADQTGHSDKIIMTVADGSYCNKKVYQAKRIRTELLTRARKDLRLVSAGEKLSPESFYGDPEQFSATQVFFGGKQIDVHYKEKQVQWTRLGKKSPTLRVIAIKPLYYRASKNAPLSHTKPAFLLTTDLTTPAQTLLQYYFDRWEIEVNHRDEKSIVGVGQAQVWSAQSVPRVPAFLVATYSLMLLASVQVYGTKRDEGIYGVLPKWRHHARRPSCMDLVRRLRKEIEESKKVTELSSYKTMIETAAA